jgi:hypothetical protein
MNRNGYSAHKLLCHREQSLQAFWSAIPGILPCGDTTGKAVLGVVATRRIDRIGTGVPTGIRVRSHQTTQGVSALSRVRTRRNPTAIFLWPASFPLSAEARYQDISVTLLVKLGAGIPYHGRRCYVHVAWPRVLAGIPLDAHYRALFGCRAMRRKLVDRVAGGEVRFEITQEPFFFKRSDACTWYHSRILRYFGEGHSAELTVPNRNPR